MNYYYAIFYRYSEERNGIYSVLPVTSQVTRDKDEAVRWFDEAVKVHTTPWRGNELVYVRDRKLDYMCTIKEAMFKCNEAAHHKGYYIIELGCYTHNPCE